MKTYLESIRLLKNWVATIEKAFLWLILIEAVLVVIIGISTNNLNNEEAGKIYLYVFIITLLLYLLILGFRYSYSKKYPVSIVEELESKYRLTALKSSLDRTLSVNQIMNKTINKISNFDPDGFIDEVREPFNNDNIERFGEITFNSFRSLLLEFYSNLDVVFSSKNNKYTFGIFVESKDGLIKSETPNIFLFEDELNVKKDIPSCLSLKEDYADFNLEFQYFMKSSKNNNRFEINEFNEKSNVLTMITNPIRVDRGFLKQDGVLFILTDMEKSDFPFDLESIIVMFSSLIALSFELVTMTIGSSTIKNLFQLATKNNSKNEES